MKTNKIGLGSVQFGINYGISNNDGITKYDEVKRIIKFSKEKGIDMIDTAFGYGKAEEILGKIGVNYFNIVSKFNSKNKNEIYSNLELSLKKLNTKSLYGYLAHKPSMILENLDIWNIMNDLKDFGKVKKIGFSFNDPIEVEKMLDKNILPDIVQIPFNIFDNRFKKSFKFLKKNNVEIHSRSAFLQGLLFIKPNKLPHNLKAFYEKLFDLNILVKKNKLDISALSIIYCTSQLYIDKVIIGVQSLDQLKQNLDIKISLNEDLISELKELNFKKKLYLLNPSNW